MGATLTKRDFLGPFETAELTSLDDDSRCACSVLAVSSPCDRVETMRAHAPPHPRCRLADTSRRTTTRVAGPADGWNAAWRGGARRHWATLLFPRTIALRALPAPSRITRDAASSCLRHQGEAVQARRRLCARPPGAVRRRANGGQPPRRMPTSEEVLVTVRNEVFFEKSFGAKRLSDPLFKPSPPPRSRKCFAPRPIVSSTRALLWGRRLLRHRQIPSPSPVLHP